MVIRNQHDTHGDLGVRACIREPQQNVALDNFVFVEDLHGDLGDLPMPHDAGKDRAVVFVWNISEPNDVLAKPNFSQHCFLPPTSQPQNHQTKLPVLLDTAHDSEVVLSPLCARLLIEQACTDLVSLLRRHFFHLCRLLDSNSPALARLTTSRRCRGGGTQKAGTPGG